MPKTFKLTQGMDLIKIHKEGNFETFKTTYIEYKKEFDECSKLYESIVDEYFPEIAPGLVDHSKISEEDYEKLSPSEQADYLLDDGSKLREHLFEDERVIRFLEIENNHLKDCEEEPFKFDISINDENGKKFYSLIKNKRMVELTYSTIIEDAKEYGAPEVVDFIEKHPLDRFQVYKNYHKKFNEKLIAIRKEAGLSIKEFADKLDVKPATIKRMENSLYINEKALNAYANYCNQKLYDFLEYDVLKSWIHELHHDMFFMKANRSKK